MQASQANEVSPAFSLAACRRVVVDVRVPPLLILVMCVLYQVRGISIVATQLFLSCLWIEYTRYRDDLEATRSDARCWWHQDPLCVPPQLPTGSDGMTRSENRPTNSSIIVVPGICWCPFGFHASKKLERYRTIINTLFL